MASLKVGCLVWKGRTNHGESSEVCVWSAVGGLVGLVGCVVRVSAVCGAGSGLLARSGALGGWRNWGARSGCGRLTLAGSDKKGEWNWRTVRATKRRQGHSGSLVVEPWQWQEQGTRRQGRHQGLQHTHHCRSIAWRGSWPGVVRYRSDTSTAEETSRSLRLGRARDSVYDKYLLL